METHIHQEKGTVIISIKGRMDAMTSLNFERGLSGMIAKGERSFLINMSQMEYMSSAGLNVLYKILRQLKSLGGKLRFTGLQDPIRELFEISGFNALFAIYETEEEALRS